MQTRLDNLNNAIEGLEKEVGRLRNEFRRRTLGVVAVVAIVAIVGVLFARSEINSARQIAQNNQRLCPVIAVFADPTGAQSTTARGKQIQKEFQRLAQEFNCPPG